MSASVILDALSEDLLEGLWQCRGVEADVGAPQGEVAPDALRLVTHARNEDRKGVHSRLIDQLLLGAWWC